MILKAQRPVIYAGGGVILSKASEELTKFAEFLQIPVTTTLMGLGGFPGGRPQTSGWGCWACTAPIFANMSVHHADVLIAVGARFDDRVTGKISEFAPNAKIIHIDVDPTTISKNVVVDIPIVGDCQDAFSQLNELVAHEPIGNWQEHHLEWLEQIRQWKQDYPLTYKHEGELSNRSLWWRSSMS